MWRLLHYLLGDGAGDAMGRPDTTYPCSLRANGWTMVRTTEQIITQAKKLLYVPGWRCIRMFWEHIEGDLIL